MSSEESESIVYGQGSLDGSWAAGGLACGGVRESWARGYIISVERGRPSKRLLQPPVHMTVRRPVRLPPGAERPGPPSPGRRRRPAFPTCGPRNRSRTRRRKMTCCRCVDVEVTPPYLRRALRCHNIRRLRTDAGMPNVRSLTLDEGRVRNPLRLEASLAQTSAL